MLILGVDTSGKDGSTALVKFEPGSARTMELVPLVGGTFSAQLVPQISELLSRHGLNKRDIDGFAVVSGPGSFTGLRVGLAAIKALAEILEKPIVPVSLLEVIARASGLRGKVAAAIDAGRKELYAGTYEVAGDEASLVKEQLVSREEFLTLAQNWSAATSNEELAAFLRASGVPVVAVEGVNTMVARLGWQKFMSGKTVTPEQLEANYVRRTDAELLVKRSF